ncbi:50S ribosomal protein L29 [Candidatus Woesebacteria bacterium]|nr:50S ribosomal protein L29 [Candidatus Woesebacteria bacterium]
MKKQSLQEIIKKGESSVMAQVQAFKLELQKIKLEASRGELKNTRASRNIRRSIAQLLTSLNLAKIVKEQS